MFIVMENSFSYNDEYYTREDGGNPIKIVKSQDKAEKIALNLEIKKFKETNLRDYCYNFSGDSLVDQSFVNTVQKFKPEIADPIQKIADDSFNFKDFTDEQLKEIIQFIDLEFYSVKECEFVK